MTYDGTKLTMTITDTVTNATFTHFLDHQTSLLLSAEIPLTWVSPEAPAAKPLNKKSFSWTYSQNGSSQQAAATPNISPATGTYTSAQIGDHHRRDRRLDDLLHARWQPANHFFDAIHRFVHGEHDDYGEGYRHRAQFHAKRNGDFGDHCQSAITRGHAIISPAGEHSRRRKR